MNSVKRLLIAALAISLLVFVFSCENKAPHVHTFSENWTSDSTHHWHIPTCDDTKEVDGKAEHKFGEGKVTKEATVDAEGECTYTCSVCGYEKKEVIEKHKHVFSTEWTSDDNHHWHATECGHTDAEEKIKHTYDEGVVSKEATATEEGEKTYTCTACGKKNIVKTGTSDHVHTYEKELSSDETYHWYKPTCEHTTEIKGKTKHSYGNGVTTDATCTEDGKTTYKCTSCDYSYSVTIPKKGHSFANSWSSDDEYHWHDATCGHSDAETKEKHTNKVTINTPATCVKGGDATSTCSICNKSVETTIDKNANNHPEESLSWRYDSYLTKKSYKAQFCSACNKFTGKTEYAEEGVEPLTGYWISEEFETYGYKCIETLSFDESAGTAILEVYTIHDGKFVLEGQQEFKFKLKFTDAESELASIILTYTYTYMEDSTEISVEETTEMNVLDGDAYNVIVASFTNPDTGVKYNIKHTKVSNNVHTTHKMKSIDSSGYLNIDVYTSCHYVPTNCDEDLHMEFYIPEEHTTEYYSRNENDTCTCTKCKRVRPLVIFFHAFEYNKEGAIDSLDNYYKEIERKTETQYFEGTGDTFTVTGRDGKTYKFEGINVWNVTLNNENLKGKKIELKDFMEINLYYTTLKIE